MVRAAALAACLLALAAGAAAAPPVPLGPGSCTRGHLKLELVAAPNVNDPIGKCLTSAVLDIFDDCSIQLTSLQSNGVFLENFFSSDPAVPPTSAWVECPAQRPPVLAYQGSGSKLEAVRRAVIKAFASFIYGLDADGEYLNELEVPDLDFFPGKLIVKRMLSMNVVYAITEADVSRDDMLQDDDITPLGDVPDCTALSHPLPEYDASALCLGNDAAHGPCPPNSYGVMVVLPEDTNAWNEKEKAFKVCGLCPAGTSGDGYGCTSCLAGWFSEIGGDCVQCPIGTYSSAGSSACLPCPTGSYSNTPGTAECKQCPEDTYAWIPGSVTCLRCINGIPEECPDGVCPSGTPIPNVPKSSPGTMIVDVEAMTADDGTCNLGATSNEFEIKAWTKCTDWTGKLQFALEVGGDCAIQVSPISDPSCADPFSTVGHQYGAIQQRVYYTSDGFGNFAIKSRPCVTREMGTPTALSIESLGGDVLLAKWIPTTTDSSEFLTNPIYKEVCKATMIIKGGNVLLNGPMGFPLVPATWECPAGSYYHALEVCPICPVGYTCPGGNSADADKIPCNPNTYNGILGLTEACTECPGAGPGTFTNYAAAQQCDVERLDLLCDQDTAFSYAFDKASQECKKCPAGTWRNYGVSTECTDCPEGHYSAEGDKECSTCPEGEYAPSPGLPDQIDITGFHCIKCAEGSMPLTDANVDPATGGAGTGATAGRGSSFCDACPAGTWLPKDDEPCRLCPQDTYRAGDATPENNVCKPIPPGYRLEDGTHTSIVLCEVGTVSFYDNGDQGTGKRIPADDEQTCAACSSLDAALGVTQWAHTFAPRKGMTQCIPCPGGTVPKDNVDGQTTTCTPCDNGSYRDAYTVASVCTDCKGGFEVGPSSKMECTQCRPGTFMDETRAAGTGVEANTCDLCPQHTYRPTFGALSCLPCPRGTQTSNKGNVECTPCPIGYFNNKVQSACTAAPPGTFVNTTGAFVSTPCPKGSWNNELAQDNCNPCAPGKYSNTLGSKECKTCPAGTYSAGQATACIDCRPGYSASAGAAACSPCKPGTYAPDFRSASCKLCPKGYQCPTNAMNRAGPCPRGTFSNKEGNRLCTPCPVNTLSLGGGSAASPIAVMACIKCPPGSNTRGLVGQSRCQVIRPQVKRLMF